MEEKRNIGQFEDAELIVELRERLSWAPSEKLSKLGIMLLNLGADAARLMAERNVNAPIQQPAEYGRPSGTPSPGDEDYDYYESGDYDRDLEEARSEAEHEAALEDERYETYEAKRIAELEAEGMSHSDAQAVYDAENQ